MHDDSSHALRTWGDFAVEVAVAFAAAWLSYECLAAAESWRDFLRYAIFGSVATAFAMAAVADLIFFWKGGGYGTSNLS